MGEIVTEMRALQLFETFARVKRPLRLSELAAEMDMPTSSCFALVKRLTAEGHLFEPVEKRGYYPTGRLRAWTAVIAAHDPITQRVKPVLEALRDTTDETVNLGRISGAAILYVSAFESRNPIRMAGRIGGGRPLHSAAAGKALLGALADDERAALLKQVRFEKLTPHTLVSAAEVEADLAEAAARGYYLSCEESIEGAMAVAVPLLLSGEPYAIQVAGPIARMRTRLDAVVAALAMAARTLGDAPPVQRQTAKAAQRG